MPESRPSDWQWARLAPLLPNKPRGLTTGG